MAEEADTQFYDRADAHIHLSNDQIDGVVTKGKVSASMMFAAARFNVWVSATGWNNGNEMGASKNETIEYFALEYRKMLEENIDDYVDNFDSYMRPDA